MGISIRQLPTTDRPRERLRSLGAKSMTSSELLAIVLGAGARERSALVVGQDLLGVCNGSLREVASRPVSHLTKVRGVGETRAVLVHAALELGRRMAVEEQRALLGLHDERALLAYFLNEMAATPVEELRVATFNTQYRMTSERVVTRGILNGALCHPREVFRHAVAENAYAIAIVHNHPSGDPTPSTADEKMTAQIEQAGVILGIELADHYIIGHGCYYSWRRQRIFK